MSARDELYREVMPDLAELCRNHDVGLELISCCDDVDQLLERVLTEFERRLETVSIDSLERDAEPASYVEAQRLRALVMFSSQAAALKEKAVASEALRERAQELEQSNRELAAALTREARARRQLDDVLESVDSGLLILDEYGCVANANRFACELAGQSHSELLGSDAVPFVGTVEPDANGEVLLDGQSHRVLLVTRRSLSAGSASEVVLISDVTARDERVAERHRLDKLGEMMKTVGVLGHKINNPLTSLMGRAQILQMNRDLDPQVLKAAQVIEEASRRISLYIRELADLAKEGKAEALIQALEMPGSEEESGV